jgi:hypothetical protein
LFPNLSTGNEGAGLMFLGRNKNRNRDMKNKELANHFYKERDADCPGFQRVKQLSTDKISMVIQMVNDAIKTGFEPAYVLADSWFMCVTFVSEIQKIKIRYAKKAICHRSHENQQIYHN